MPSRTAKTKTPKRAWFPLNAEDHQRLLTMMQQQYEYTGRRPNRYQMAHDVISYLWNHFDNPGAEVSDWFLPPPQISRNGNAAEPVKPQQRKNPKISSGGGEADEPRLKLA